MNKLTGWKFDYMQIWAIILTIGIGLGLNYSGAKAESVAGDQIATSVKVELSADQPVKVVELESQRVASFTLSTQNLEPISVTGLVFWLQGSLQSEVITYPNLFPLTVSSDDASISGRGEIWKYADGYIAQEIIFDQPIEVSLTKSVKLNVYMDLQNQAQATVQVWLAKAISSVLIQGLPIESILLEVKSRA